MSVAASERSNNDVCTSISDTVQFGASLQPRSRSILVERLADSLPTAFTAGNSLWINF